MFDQGEYSVQEYTSRQNDSVYSTNTLVIVIFGFSPFLARVVVVPSSRHIFRPIVRLWFLLAI